MKIKTFFIATLFSFAYANPIEENNELKESMLSPFQDFNLRENGELMHSCKDPSFFIEAADIEESKPENQDKIILYHGQSYGVWIYQLILKAFMFPEAHEDWLPLRFDYLKNEITKNDLMKIIGPNSNDHSRRFTEIGLPVSPNLVNKNGAESAWGKICDIGHRNWHKISGYSDWYGNLHKSLYQIIREKFIPQNRWTFFKRQKKLINQFIQIKRELVTHYKIQDFKDEMEYYYPDTLKKYKKEFEKIFAYSTSSQDVYYEGVALQIIMDKNLADELTYNSYPFGWVKSKLHPKFNGGRYVTHGIWKGEDIEPYSEIYKQVKNKIDDEQARLALNNDFRVFPSRVKIKAIAGIMQNLVDYEILKSMIHEMVQVNKKDKRKSGLFRFFNLFNKN